MSTIHPKNFSSRPRLYASSPLARLLLFRRFGSGLRVALLGPAVLPPIWPWLHLADSARLQLHAISVALVLRHFWPWLHFCRFRPGSALGLPCPAKSSVAPSSHVSAPAPNPGRVCVLRLRYPGSSTDLLLASCCSLLPTPSVLWPDSSIAFLRPASTLPFFPKSAKTKKNGKG